MRLFTPDRDAIRGLQERDGRLYFSNAAALLFGKYGLVTGESAAGFVTRETPWSDLFADGAFVFEGPLAAEVAARLGIEPIPLAAESLALETPDGTPLGPLLFQAMQLRRIPRGRGERSDPYVFRAADARWTPERFAYQAFEAGAAGDPILFARDAAGHRHLVGLRRGTSIVLGIPLLDIIGQHHMAGPYPDGYYGVDRQAPIEALERWLIEAAAGLFRSGAAPLLQIDPWPHPWTAAFSVRHDFDRKLDRLRPRELRQILDILRLVASYARFGVKSTWFWRVHSSFPILARLIRACGHEIALHTEAGTREAFAAETRFFMQSGLPPLGYTAHGGAGSAGYVGQSQMRWAAEHGMLYGELLGHGTTLTTPAVILEDDVPAIGGLVMPAMHRSLDRNMTPEGHFLDSLIPEVSDALAAGGYCIVMNHPDIHIDQLIALLRKTDFAHVWRATMADVARWARVATIGARRVRTGQDSDRVTFPERLPRAAVLNVRSRDGEQRFVLPRATRCVDVVTRDGAVGATAAVGIRRLTLRPHE